MVANPARGVKINISLYLFAAENLVSQDRSGLAVSLLAHSP